MKRLLIALPIVALALGGSTACATKKFVRTSVGEVNEKVEGVTKSVEETQQRIARNEESIGQADRKADAAGQSAADARMAANTARSAADAAATRAEAVSAHVDEVDKANKRLVFEVTLSEDQGNFKFGKTALPDDARAQIDALVAKLLENPNGAYLEIEGHTDNRGGKMVNEKLGLERAENVKRYLYETHKIPLHKMNVISYGMDKPIAPNKTRDGRAQNRRVVIKVLT